MEEQGIIMVIYLQSSCVTASQYLKALTMYDVAKFVKKDERYIRYGFFYLALKYASIMEPPSQQISER